MNKSAYSVEWKNAFQSFILHILTLQTQNNHNHFMVHANKIINKFFI